MTRLITDQKGRRAKPRKPLSPRLQKILDTPKAQELARRLDNFTPPTVGHYSLPARKVSK